MKLAMPILHTQATADLGSVENSDWRLYESDIDLFGDGSLRFFKLPGHSAG